jgi:hypothetical protein
MARRRWKIEDIKSVIDGENPFIQVGYDKPDGKHKVGDVWDDVHGVTWEQKKGYKTRVNKNVDSIRESLKQVCSKCNKDIRLTGNRFDDKMFPKTGMCLDCLTEYEQDLFLSGKFESYEKKKVLSNQLSYLKDIKSKLDESVDYLENNKVISFVNEFGDVETWTNECRDTLLDGARGDLEKINKDIEDTEKMLESIKD